MAVALTSEPNPLQIDFCGLDMASPIVLLSGCVGFGEEYTRIDGFSNCDVGGIVLKGTTLEPRLGNPPHRVYETPMGMLNAIGLHVCENLDCLMNNADSVGEQEDASLLLCPTCMRKLHLMGVVADVPACHARVKQLLDSKGLE